MRKCRLCKLFSACMAAMMIISDSALLHAASINTTAEESSSLTDSSAVYEDISETDWFYESSVYHYGKGIMTGLTETQFGPYENLSRAQLVTILYRLHGSPELWYINTNPQIFADITEDDWYGWYGSALSWARNNAVVEGYENGCFGPADNITREQLCVMLYRYAKGAGMDITNQADLSLFYDANGVSTFATDAVKWAVGAGILTGKANGTVLDPHGTATRAEAAVMMYRFDRQKNEVITGYKVLIDENDITTEIDMEYYKNIDCILVPFVKTMEAAGADIEWIEESCVKILYKDMEYIIDIKEGKLIDNSTGRSFAIPSPHGLDDFYMVTESEVYLDIEAFKGYLGWTDVYFNYEVDHQNKIIRIDFLDDVIEPEAYKLIVNGQDITEGTYLEVHKNYHYTLLPLTAVLEALGAEVKWNSETTADIVYNSREYVLDLEKVSLVEKDDEYGWEIIGPVPDGRLRYKIVDGELLLDDVTFESSVMQMGMNTMIYVDVDYENHSILIDYRE